MAHEDEPVIQFGIVFCIGLLLGISLFLYWATFVDEEPQNSPTIEFVGEDHG